MESREIFHLGETDAYIPAEWIRCIKLLRPPAPVRGSFSYSKLCETRKKAH